MRIGTTSDTDDRSFTLYQGKKQAIYHMPNFCREDNWIYGFQTKIQKQYTFFGSFIEHNWIEYNEIIVYKIDVVL